MMDLLVGTKKGLFTLGRRGDGTFAVAGRAFAGLPVEYAMRDPRSGRTIASVSNPFYGPKLWWTDDPFGEWRQASGLEIPGGEAALERIWVVRTGVEDGVLYAGGDPGVLFESRDGGESWAIVAGLWDDPGRPGWQPGGGGLCVHTIVPWPSDPRRLTLGVSAVGVLISDDGGATWRRSNDGIMPRYLPEEARDDPDRPCCVHAMVRAAARPERLFMQFHGGVYRSDDAGASWIDIGDGLPADFGFPIATDPADPDCAYVIPLTGDGDRVTAGGAVRVYVTRDAGATWTACGDGLPTTDAYLTVLREAFDSAGEGSGLELYFGATSGDVFASLDAGRGWSVAATRLPPVYSVRAAG